MPESLKNRLAFSHLAVIFITAALMGVGSYMLLIKNHRQATLSHLRTTASHSALHLETYLDGKEELLHKISESRDVLEFADTFRELSLAHYLRQFADDFTSIRYIAANGRQEIHMVGDKPQNDLADFAKSPLFRRAIANPKTVLYDDDLRSEKEPVIALAIAGQAKFSDEIGPVIYAELSLAMLGREIEHFSHEDDFIFAQNRLGRIRIHPQAGYIDHTVSPPLAEKGFASADRLGKAGYYTIASLPKLDWVFVAVMPEEVYAVYPNTLKARAIFAFLFTCMIGTIASQLVARKLTEPLISLTKTARRIAEGKSTKPIPIASKDEVGILIESFNSMIASLKETTISRDYVDNVLQSLHECLLLVSEDGVITFANRMTCNLLGYGENDLVGRQIGTIMPEVSITGRINDQQSIVLEEETELLAHDGGKIMVLFSRSFLRDKENNLLGTICLAQDIRQRKADEKEKAMLHAQLQQAQRLETIGTLAGGIAHDFNNILTAIIGFSQLGKRMVPEDNPARQAMDNSLTASFRAKDLVKQLLSFSRQGNQQKAPLLLASIVKEIVKLLRATIPPTVEIKQQIDPQCSKVLADPSQIHQLIMNLCTNAIQAMEDKGTLSISVANVRLGEQDIQFSQDLTPGNYVRIQIGDNGPGIAPDIMHRIFDPFFTTKGVDMGSGLGLAVAHGIVKSHHGDIEVSSELEHGTTFTIYLPAYEVEESVEEGKKKEGSSQGRGEHILFVDDESPLTMLAEQGLTSHGFRVTAVCSSEKALELFRASPASYDLLVTDYAMPKLDGVQLVAELLALRPDLPIMLCTGYSQDLNRQASPQNSIRRIVLKPYTQEELASHIRQVLDDPKAEK